MDKASNLSNLLEKGDPKSLQKALSELGSALGDVRKMLEGNAESFGENRFAQENKAVSEALRQIGELESDERMLAGDWNTTKTEPCGGASTVVPGSSCTMPQPSSAT